MLFLRIAHDGLTSQGLHTLDFARVATFVSNLLTFALKLCSYALFELKKLTVQNLCGTLIKFEDT